MLDDITGKSLELCPILENDSLKQIDQKHIFLINPLKNIFPFLFFIFPYDLSRNTLIYEFDSLSQLSGVSYEVLPDVFNVVENGSFPEMVKIVDSLPVFGFLCVLVAKDLLCPEN